MIMSYDIIGIVKNKNKIYQLYKGEDKKWYKAIKCGEYSIDQMNNPNTHISNYSEITPLTKEEFEQFFK